MEEKQKLIEKGKSVVKKINIFFIISAILLFLGQGLFFFGALVVPFTVYISWLTLIIIAMLGFFTFLLKGIILNFKLNKIGEINNKTLHFYSITTLTLVVIFILDVSIRFITNSW